MQTPADQPASSPVAVQSSTARWVLAAVLVLMGVSLRLIDHPLNFAPVAGIALFAGACFDRRAWAYAVPLTIMLLTDLVIGLHPGMLFVYPSYAAIVFLGTRLQPRRNPLTVVGSAITGSLLFFFVTNFGAWLISHGMPDEYPRTLAGLWQAYVAGIPFFRATLVGDVLFSSVLFGAAALAVRCFPRLAAQPAPVPVKR